MRLYGGPMANWRRDAVEAQQLVLPQVVGLLLVLALLNAMIIPSPYGFIICGVMLTLLAVLLRRNAQRRRRGIAGWSNTLIFAPFVASTVVVIIGHLVSDLLAGVVAVAIVVGGLVLLVRRSGN